jgi:cell wall-associated NlpC family hydrolase
MPTFDDKRLQRPAGEATAYQVTAAAAAVREAPSSNGRLATQALHGEILDVFAEEGEFGFAQCRRDRYCGWVLMEALSSPLLQPTHKVSSPKTHCYSEPDLKSAPRFLLSQGSRLTVSGWEGDWLYSDRGGWVHTRHVAPADVLEDDPVAVAERFLRTPYLWGGRESSGLDCTGLTQQAFEAAGVILPRDSDMQFEWAGEDIPGWRKPQTLRRGDLVFWKGHVGIMTDADHLLHANAWHMAVAVEPLETAITRIANYYAEPIGARRIDVLSERERTPDWRVPSA